MRLELREPNMRDAAAYAQLVARLPADTPNFLFGYDPRQPMAAHIARLLSMQNAESLPKDWVPATFLFAFDRDRNEIVGRASIRHTLNEQLAREGGHIGYAVLPAHRNKGIATQILAQSLMFARTRLQLESILVTCDEDNIASRKVIEKNGGEYTETVAVADGPAKRHYWFH